MKFLPVLLVAFACSFCVKAAPGDTTWVQANKAQLNNYGDFDTSVQFPDGSVRYRKVIMMFTVGKYLCPGSPTYCSDWDYTVQTYAMNKTGDTVELGRLITPYAKGARMPASWQQTFSFDVTDYATVLKDSNKIRIHYSGYSGGFTADIKFALIEGTPERTVIGVKSMWNGSFQYGDPADPIDTKFAAQSLTAPTGTQNALYRVNITGHGGDLNGCSEFCQKYYRVIKDGSIVKEKLIWRDNCGLNNLYPQSGTWIYDRGNWCPGDLVHTIFHPLPGITAGTTFNLGMTFEPYTRNLRPVDPSYPQYTVYGSVIYYGGMNKVLDASLEDIIAPTDDANHFRENARIGFTTVKIRNSGSDPVSSIEFEYGVSGQPLTKTTWTGALASLTDTVINLPYATSLFAATGTNVPYEVTILKVNGTVDNDATNNKFTSTFTPVPEWPSKVMIYLTTNKAAPLGISETEWSITDASNTVVASRKGNDPSKAYIDTVLLPTGNYRLAVTDAGCDGLSFWANPAAGSGSFQVRSTAFILPLKGYFSGDFGCGFLQEFRVGTPTAIHNVNLEGTGILSVYPNPAQDQVTIAIDGIGATDGIINITDNTGKVVYTSAVNQNSQRVDTRLFSNGVYFVGYYTKNGSAPAIMTKLVIVK